MSDTPKISPAPQATSVAAVVEKFGDAVLATHAEHGDHTVVVVPEKLVEVISFLKTEPALDFNMLMDLCGVDYLPRRPRFEVVYHLYSLKHNHRVRVKVQLDAPEPCVDTITPLYKIADWFEREVWDMFGITFTGHPDLRRILMYEQFEGHPLRRDYPFAKRQPIVKARTRHL